MTPLKNISVPATTRLKRSKIPRIDAQSSFQKLNASSLRAIRAALGVRLERLEKRLAHLPPEEEEEQEADQRYLGEQEERAALKSDRELLKDEIAVLKRLLSMRVSHEKKIDRLRELLKQIDRENPGTRVLIFTEYRRTQEFLREKLEELYGPKTVVLINGDMKLEGKTPDAESKRRSQRLFRDEPSVRFLVSTEAGGEGIDRNISGACHLRAQNAVISRAEVTISGGVGPDRRGA